MNNSPWSSVLSNCLDLLPPPRHERVARSGALGRLMLEPIVADRDYPIGDLSMMDGYAVQESPGRSYVVEGENRPGCGPGKPLAQGDARRIFTGAELPLQATRVVPQELIQRNGDQLEMGPYPETTFVRTRGSETKRGETVLESGTRLGPVELSILAALGISTVQVAALPRVAHLATGSELADPDSPAPGSLTRDSNSDLVTAVLRHAGYGLVAQRRLGDDRDLLIQTIHEMTDKCDVLLISGGASVGDHDYTRNALETSGFHFETHGVHLRPGKPVGLARRGHQWAIALPGNPVSHLVTLHLFVLPILRGLEGSKDAKPKLVQGFLQGTLSTEVPRRPTFWPSTMALVDGQFHLHPRRFLSSGDLLGIAHVSALLYLPADVAIPPQGAPVLFLPLTSGANF
jgi:molybdopterin molybdotransferase